MMKHDAATNHAIAHFTYHASVPLGTGHKVTPRHPDMSISIADRWRTRSFDELSHTATPLLHLPREIVWEENIQSWKDFASTISERVIEFDANAHRDVAEFAATQLAVLAYDSNRLEGTVNVDGSTFTMIRQFIDGYTVCGGSEEWEEEGAHPSSLSTKHQMFQFCLAAKALHTAPMFHQPLSVALLCRIHGIMMGGSTLGRDAGEIRTTDVCAGGRGGSTHVFVPPAHVHAALGDLIAEYNSDQNSHPVQRAALLLYRLLSIHPFRNGNGRLARLFASWSLVRDGFPFAVALSSGHRSAQRHYLHAIDRARGFVYGAKQTLAELNAIVLVSLARVFANLLDSSRRVPVDSNTV
jgi:Fic family protein